VLECHHVVKGELHDQVERLAAAADVARYDTSVLRQKICWLSLPVYAVADFGEVVGE
jgi:hypothetical protein